MNFCRAPKSAEIWMKNKEYLLSPGPTPIPAEVLAEAAQPIRHHRTAEFSKIFAQTASGLRYVFQTQNDVYILATSGSGAMEAAVVNILQPGDRVVSISTGKFGARWGDICRGYGLEIHEVILDWGKDYPPEKLAAAMEDYPGTRAVFTSLSETSTGTIYDIRGYAGVVSQTEALLVVDGISGIGAMPCPMDEWKIDVLISGSQKAFMTPPGLSYIAFNPRAWEAVEKASLPRYYLDARKYKQSMSKNTSPFTPAISLLGQQCKALERIRAVGLKRLFDHHRILGDATRAGIRALRLELLSQKPGNILTAVRIPPGLDGRELIDIMQKRYGVYIAGAQDPHKGEFFRIGHLGYISGFDIITALAALEMTLRDMGYPVEGGESVKAAQFILKECYHEKNTSM